MSIEKLFDSKCNIFHLQKSSQNLNYGLPSSAQYTYSDLPDLTDIPCHFSVLSISTAVIQKQPQNILTSRIKLSLPFKTDICINDKIIDCTSGLEYTAEQPRNIRNHHIVLYIQRINGQEAL